MSLLCFPGFYRVNYDEENWKLLVKYLQNPNLYSRIAPANRAQLVDDALNLARGNVTLKNNNKKRQTKYLTQKCYYNCNVGGRLNYKTALDITRYLAHENDYVPLKSAMNALNFIDAMLMKGGEYHKLKV